MIKLQKNGKYLVQIVFGQSASGMVDDVVSAYHEGVEEGGDADGIKAGVKYIDEAFGADCFNISSKEFNTEPEAEAYLDGVYDGEGWMGYYALEVEQAEIIEKVIKTREEV